MRDNIRVGVVLGLHQLFIFYEPIYIGKICKLIKYKVKIEGTLYLSLQIWYNIKN